jgi:hypothetical protein
MVLVVIGGALFMSRRKIVRWDVKYAAEQYNQGCKAQNIGKDKKGMCEGARQILSIGRGR